MSKEEKKQEEVKKGPTYINLGGKVLELNLILTYSKEDDWSDEKKPYAIHLNQGLSQTKILLQPLIILFDNESIRNKEFVKLDQAIRNQVGLYIE